MVRATHMGGIWFDAKLNVSLSPERFSMSRLRVGGVALLLFASSLALSPAKPASAALSGGEFTLGEIEEISETGKIVTYRAPDGGLRHRDLATNADIGEGASFVRSDGRYRLIAAYKKYGDASDNIIIDDATTAKTDDDALDVSTFLNAYPGYTFLDVQDMSSNGKFVLFRIEAKVDGAFDDRLFAWDVVGKKTVELDAGLPRTVSGTNAFRGAARARISDDGKRAVFVYLNYIDQCDVKVPGAGCLFTPYWTTTDAVTRDKINRSPALIAPPETYVNDIAISGDGKVAAFQSFGTNVTNDADVLYHNRVYVHTIDTKTTSFIADRGTQTNPQYTIDLDVTGDRISYYDFRATTGSNTPMFQPIVKVRSTGAIIEGSFPAGGTPIAPADYMTMSRNGEWIGYQVLAPTAADPFATKSYLMKLDAGRIRRIVAGTFIEVAVGGIKGIPANAASAALNVTALNAADDGYLTVWPCGSPQPGTSNLNYLAGEAVPNLVVSKLGTDGKICVFSSAETDVFVDANGYFPAGSPFEGIVPDRRLDTRPNKLAAGGDTSAVVTGATKAGATIPANASAVVVNVTATGEAADGFLTLWPCGSDRPADASVLNFQKGIDRANLSLAKVGDGGKVCIYSSAATNVVVDVMGYFTGDSTFTPQTPARLLDTRKTAIVAAGGRAVVTVPAGLKAVALNVASVSAAADGYATVWPCDEAQPDASNVNYAGGGAVANAVIVKVGPSNTVCIFSDKASHYLADLSGSFPGGSSFVPVNPVRIFDTR
jgi:hypothetical protein